MMWPKFNLLDAISVLLCGALVLVPLVVVTRSRLVARQRTPASAPSAVGRPTFDVMSCLSAE